MSIEIQGLTGLIVLVLNVWAIIQIVQSGATTGGKVFWTVLILLLPILGFIIWLLAGPRAPR
ncbi:MAG: PLD nuclease N-terminal domain-containing protein [Gammaproteobacteria bacterium SHHR-1]